MALPGIGSLWAFGRKLEDLFALHRTVAEALQLLDERLRGVEDRLLRLETEQGQVVSEARSAATAASTMVAGSIISEAVTRLTRLEGRTEQIEQRQQRRRPPP